MIVQMVESSILHFLHVLGFRNLVRDAIGLGVLVLVFITWGISALFKKRD